MIDFCTWFRLRKEHALRGATIHFLSSEPQMERKGRKWREKIDLNLIVLLQKICGRTNSFGGAMSIPLTTRFAALGDLVVLYNGRETEIE